MHSLIAAMSPFRASSMALRVMLSASPSSSTSIARVVLLRAPAGRPLGLPLWPGLKRADPCFGPVFSGSEPTCLLVRIISAL